MNFLPHDRAWTISDVLAAVAWVAVLPFVAMLLPMARPVLRIAFWVEIRLMRLRYQLRLRLIRLRFRLRRHSDYLSVWVPLIVTERRSRVPMRGPARGRKTHLRMIRRNGGDRGGGDDPSHQKKTPRGLGTCAGFRVSDLMERGRYRQQPHVRGAA